MNFLEVPIIILLTVVLPIWLVLHYVTQWKKTKTISAEDETNLGQLRRDAQKLEDRLESMERILDEEVPDWRQRHHDQI